MGRGTFREVRDGSRELPIVREGSGTLSEVWDGSRDPQKGPGRVGGPSRRSGTSRRTLPEIQDGSGARREVRER